VIVVSKLKAAGALWFCFWATGCLDFRPHADPGRAAATNDGSAMDLPWPAEEAATAGPADGAAVASDLGPDSAPRNDDAAIAPTDRPASQAPDGTTGADVAVADTAPPLDAMTTQPPASGVVSLVVGNTAALSAGDATIRTILAIGFVVRLVDDNAAAVTSGADVVVLSGSCSSATIGTKYRDVPLPVVTMDAATFDAMGMTGTSDSDFGETQSSSVSIVMAGHPLAASLSGTVSVVSASASLGWGRPGPGAARVATVAGMADQVAIFAYPTGAMMVGGTAPAPRVGFFASDAATARLSDDGVKLLRAAIDWASP
jgi:hypothetical protein